MRMEVSESEVRNLSKQFLVSLSNKCKLPHLLRPSFWFEMPRVSFSISSAGSINLDTACDTTSASTFSAGF